MIIQRNHLSADNFDFVDQSGHGQNVSGVNVQFVPTPWDGNAFYFDGNAHIEIPDIDNSLDIYGDYTIEMMVLPLYKQFAGVFYKGENGYANYSICYAHFNNNQGWQENYGGGTGSSGSWRMFFGKWTKITFIKKGNQKVLLIGNEYEEPNSDATGIEENVNVYFCHSYYVRPDNSEDVSTITDYGIEFASSICKDNIFGVQFHPEKSQKIGLKIIKNFVNFV